MAKKMKKLTMQYSPRYLSDDILFQILSRLRPVKSLLRFTSVSKSWKSCIESSSFISAHHRHQIANKTSSSHLVYIPDRFLVSVENCTLIPENNSKGARPKISVPRFSKRRTSCPDQKKKKRRTIASCRVACSCGGLICVTTKSKIFIWNPFIVRHKEIPAGKIRLSRSCRLGFGFSTQSGDYRLVKLHLTKLYGGKHLITEVEIYSLSSDSWRRIKPKNYANSKGVSFKGYNNYSSPLSLKGSIYWFCDLFEFENNGCVIYTILRFDLDKEIFEEINVPISSLQEPLPTSSLHESLVSSFNNLVVAKSNGYLVVLMSQYETMEHICMRAYINKEFESESGLRSSSWNRKDFVLLKMTREIRGTKVKGYWPTPSGHIIVEGEDGRIFAYYWNFDGNDWSYELRDLGINKMKDDDFDLFPITETLLLLDEK